MGTYIESKIFQMPLGNGQTIDVTVTYKATYRDDAGNPGITKHDFSIEPCEVVGTPQLDAIKSQITEWTKVEYLNARSEAGLIGTPGQTTSSDPDALAGYLYDDAAKCAKPPNTDRRH